MVRAGLDRRLPLVLGDEVLARRLDEFRLGDDAESGQDVGDHPRDRRLAGAGRAGEDHVLGLLRDLHPARGADLRHLRRGAIALDLLLDPGQPDLAVEFGLRVGEQPLPTGVVGLDAGRIPRVAARRDLLGGGGLPAGSAGSLSAAATFGSGWVACSHSSRAHGGVLVALAATRHRQEPRDRAVRTPRRPATSSTPSAGVRPR